MIIDKIENCERYADLHPGCKKALEALEAVTAETPTGRITVDGDAVFINHSAYTTKTHENCSFENHLRYIDIQYVVSGTERIDLCDAHDCKVTDDRLESDDIAFYENPVNFTSAVLHPGEFVLIFPGEAHRPCMAADNTPSAVVKSVAKVLY